VPGAPAVPAVPGKVPDVKKNLPNVQKNLPNGVQAPKGLPTCAPNVLPKTGVPSVGKPSLPGVNGLDCSAMPPALHTQGGQAKDIPIPNGMHLAYTHTRSVTIQSQKACAIVQRFVASGGQWLSIERVKTPPQVTLQQLAQSLKVPGSLVSLSGAQTWQNPLNTGMLWLSDKGYALYVSGSPQLAGQLPAVATSLRRG